MLLLPMLVTQMDNERWTGADMEVVILSPHMPRMNEEIHKTLARTASFCAVMWTQDLFNRKKFYTLDHNIW
jgi:hypothetical protein